MSERIMGPRGSRRRRRSLVACVASVAALGAFVMLLGMVLLALAT